VSEILGAAGLPPAALCLEVTESVLMDRTAEAIGLLRALRRAGVSLALDDFGTGFSSLSYLTRMPVDVLKIDRTFVEQVGLDVQQSEVVRAIVRLADALRLQSVAEGIETKEQWSGLVAMGCQIGQGFLFSRPLPAEELDVLLAAGVAALATPGPVASTG
jgi:EAL domain-containing protein (putative c-di-GMP-specific phosphodiesterase class I)